MNAPIVTELREFFQANGDVSCYILSRESGVSAPIIYRVISGKRKDMTSRNADALREAMRRITSNKMQYSE